ncbi:MAG: DUF2304 domain-containing protein [Gaiellaceae bacterium]
MIAIQVLLIGGIVTVLGWFVMNPRSQQVHAWIKILAAVFTSFGVVVIISPNTSNRVAHAVGVGRGADLLLYSLAVAFVYVMFSLYIRGKEEHAKFEILARTVALLEERLRELSDVLAERREESK